jgi:hypothetical protein
MWCHLLVTLSACKQLVLQNVKHSFINNPACASPAGEMRDARDNRQGLFARLSARMGFAATNSGTQQG